MEDDRVTGIERDQSSTALVEHVCIGVGRVVGRVVIEVTRAVDMGAGEDFEPAVPLIPAIEGDDQIRRQGRALLAA